MASIDGGAEPGQSGPVSGHGFSDHAVMPRDQLAAGIEAGLDMMRRHRPKLAGRDVVLAAPDHLDRAADRLGEAHGVEHHVLRPTAPSIAATDDMLVERDPGAVRLQELRDVV
jgi:hypothetical protein